MRSEVVESCRIRMYRVGFGDCFLLTVGYGEGERRHVLFDFGRTEAREGAPTESDVAEDIANHCGNDPLIIVATHRHKDHISGFTGASWNRIRGLNVVLVAQPWTEEPGLEGDARAPLHAKGLNDRTHRTMLLGMQGVAEHLLDLHRQRSSGVPLSVSHEIEFIASDNLRNAEAVTNLASFGSLCAYLKAGDQRPFREHLPGATVHVLGPPTIEQWARLGGKRTKHTEYWHLRAFSALDGTSGIGSLGSKPPLARRSSQAEVAAHTLWFQRRVRSALAEEMLGIVRALDRSINNTSLILVLEIRDEVLVFPGDAQIENWSFALEDKTFRELLQRTTFYKVGHHGSLNATPISMWERFMYRHNQRLKTALSTMENLHGNPERQTEVPRTRLVQALTSESLLTRSDAGSAHKLVEEIVLF